MRYAVRMIESAHEWNAKHKVGTLVRARLGRDQTITGKTAGLAQQWGALALIRLDNDPGIWTVGALEPVITDETS